MTIENGVVVAPQPLAVEVGVDVLRAGGNAFDAAVAAALTQTVVDPQMCGIAGFGVANCVAVEARQHVILNFYDRAPMAATPDMYTPIEGQVTGDYFPVAGEENQVGYRAVGTPGTLAGLYEVQRRFGRLAWRDVVSPAAGHARRGIVVHPDVARYWRTPATDGNVGHLDKLRAIPACARIYAPEGELPREGDLLVNSDYAATLDLIAEGGPDVIYRGEIAEAIERDFATNGGILTRADLAAYRVRVTNPVRSAFLGHQIETTPPPGGGVIVAALLKIFEGLDLGARSRTSADYVHRVATAMRAIFAARADTWGDPAAVHVPMVELLSDRAAARRREAVLAGAIPAGPGVPDSRDTTHISVIDRQGNMVGITHTLGASSGVVVPGLGFMFNNAMHKFDPRPGRPNSIAAGKSRASALSPTVVRRDGSPWMVLGSPGAFGIITGVTQAIVNIVAHGDTPLEAVSLPRIHCENETVHLEARYPTSIDAELESLGHRVQRSLLSYDLKSGLVHCAQIDTARGRAVGGADPRRGGVALTDD